MSKLIKIVLGTLLTTNMIVVSSQASDEFIHPQLYSVIEKSLIRVRIDKSTIEQYKTTADVSVKLPKFRKYIKRTTAQVKKFIQENFSHYADQESFAQEVFRVMMLYIHNQSCLEHNRLQIFLQGPYGVGKSRMVKLIAQFFGLPLVNISLTQASSGTYAIDPYILQYKPSKFTTALANPIDPITGKITTAYTNQIILLDEADREVSDMTALALQFLDPSSSPFRDDCLNATIKFDKALVFICGNSELDSGDRALSLSVPDDSSIISPITRFMGLIPSTIFGIFTSKEDEPSQTSTLQPLRAKRGEGNALDDRFITIYFPCFDPCYRIQLFKNYLRRHASQFSGEQQITIDEDFFKQKYNSTTTIEQRIAQIIDELTESGSHLSYREIMQKADFLYTDLLTKRELTT